MAQLSEVRDLFDVLVLELGVGSEWLGGAATLPWLSLALGWATLLARRQPPGLGTILLAIRTAYYLRSSREVRRPQQPWAAMARRSAFTATGSSCARGAGG